MKREAELKAAFGRELQRALPEFMIMPQAAAGAPDRAIVGAGCTTFWEFKHATPAFRSPGIQELFCMRLDRLCFCRYVIWWEAGGLQKTLIVRPSHVHFRDGWRLLAESETLGFNHLWLVHQIKRAHKVV